MNDTKARNGDPDPGTPPDECIRCGRRTTKPWVAHLIPGATLWCDGEDPDKWANGGPRDDIHRVAALAMVAGGSVECEESELIPQRVWDTLYRDDHLRIHFDQSGEGYAILTDAGRAYLAVTLDA